MHPLWFLLAGALGLLFVAAELGARRWLRWRRVYYVLQPGLRLRLHLDRDTLPDLEPVVRFDVNSEGERGSEVPRPRFGETPYRILVVGGSQPEGYLLDQDTNWPGALQCLLATPNHLRSLGASYVHVGSIARSGVGSRALDLILQRVLPRYPRVQAIVVLVGASDVLQWLEQGAPPSPPAPVRTSDVFRRHPEGPFRWGPRELALVELSLRVRDRWIRSVQVHERTGRWIGRARAMRARANITRTAVPDPAPMLNAFELHFRRALARAKAHADRVLVVGQPWFEKDHTPDELAHMWHGGAGQVWREEVTTFYSIDVLSRLMTLLDRRAARVAAELDVEHLDLMPILDRSLNTYYDFFHMAPAGARAVATAVGATILRQPVSATELPEQSHDLTLAS